nr:glycosyltransferase family 4 protein [uncultured Mucilaginibacter sp.]
MNKRKILIHTIVFSPDAVSTAYLYNDIAVKFAESGYDVVVLTTTPHYNILPEKLKEQPLVRKWGGLYYQSNYKGIKVLHVPQKKFSSPLLRICGFFYWHVVSLALGLMQKKISVILSPSPPLTIGFINIIIAKLKGAKVIYNVQEIYPDFLINQRNLKSIFVIKILKTLEKFVYNRSDAVTTIDSVFYNTILPRFKKSEKLLVIPNFVDTTIYKPLSLEQINLDPASFPVNPGVLRLLYAGNIGHAQEWETLLCIAERLRDHPVEFFIIGEGVMKPYVEEQVKKRTLQKVYILGYQPRDLMPQILAYSHLNFIFMTEGMDGQGFPSKVYTIMACEKPLLIVSGKNTPITNFLEPLECAYIVHTRDFEDRCKELVDFIIGVLNSPERLKQMGTNGFAEIGKNYSKKTVVRKYVDLVNEIIQS